MARNRFRVAFDAQRNDESEDLVRKYVVLDLGDPDEDGEYVHDDNVTAVKTFPDTPAGYGDATIMAAGLNARNEAETSAAQREGTDA